MEKKTWEEPWLQIIQTGRDFSKTNIQVIVHAVPSPWQLAIINVLSTLNLTLTREAFEGDTLNSESPGPSLAKLASVCLTSLRVLSSPDSKLPEAGRHPPCLQLYPPVPCTQELLHKQVLKRLS